MRHQEHSDIGKNFGIKITLSYMLAVVVLASLAIISFFLLHEYTYRGSYGAAKVNISGRQRMLLQKTSYLVYDLVETADRFLKKRGIVVSIKNKGAVHKQGVDGKYAFAPDSFREPMSIEVLRKRLMKTISVMRQSHKALVSGNNMMNLPSSHSSKISALYLGGPVALDSLLISFLSDAESIAKAPLSQLHDDNYHFIRIKRVLRGNLPLLLNDVVKQYQRESEREVLILESLQIAILVITLSILLALVFFVFRPMARRVRQKTSGLVDAEALHAAILSSALDPIITMDNKGRIREFNRMAEKTFGYTTSQVVGRDLADTIIPPSIRNKHRRSLANCLSGDGSLMLGKHFESIGMRSNGSKFPVDLAVTRFSIKGRAMFAGFIRDITEHKRSEELAQEHISRLDNARMQLQCRVVEVQKMQMATLNMMEDAEMARVASERAETVVRKALDEKEILLKEIHHRVKNNLQVISSILGLQGGHIEDKEARKFFVENQSRIRSMAYIHENLFQSENIERIDFSGYIRNISSYLMDIYKVDGRTIGLRFDIERVYLDVDTAIPCGLILNELVSNCLEHAFSGREVGEIFVGFHTSAEDNVLVVSNDGIEFPEGVDLKKSGSLGLQLVNDLSEQIGGRMDIERNCGTTFKVIFPVVRLEEC